MNHEIITFVGRFLGTAAFLIVIFASIEKLFGFFQKRSKIGGWELFWKASKRKRSETYEKAMLNAGLLRKEWLEKNPYRTRRDPEYQELVLSEIGATDLYFASLDGDERKRGFYDSSYSALLSELA